MYSRIFLVICFFVNAVWLTPLYDSPFSEERNGELETTQASTQTENIDFNSIGTEIADNFEAEEKISNDLTGQETFYPAGGVFWGFRPWGGWGGWGSWGGYRPWHGWHGWHGWHRPHWGGHWGGSWGGGTWGRTTSK